MDNSLFPFNTFGVVSIKLDRRRESDTVTLYIGWNSSQIVL